MKKVSIIVQIILSFIYKLSAQTPTDNIMMPASRFCGAIAYTNDQWDHYWEGTLKRTNGVIGKVTTQVITPMFALGITDKINLFASLPYISKKPSQGQFIGQYGFQDLGLGVKAQIFKKQLGPGSIELLGFAGFSTPTSNYNKDFLPFSIGLGAKEGALRGILHYELNKGMYIRAYGSYHLRSNIKLDRDFYYTDRPIYSNIVDMPDAIMYGINLGTWIKKDVLFIHAFYEGMQTQGGFDIRRQDMPLASNQMNQTSVGAFSHFYLPWLNGLSVFGSYSQVLTGRNVGQSTTITGGIAYQFKLWSTKASMAQ